MSDRPADNAVVIAALTLPQANGADWRYADEIRGVLERLGFDPSPQVVTAALKRMCDEDVPRFERRDSPLGPKQYRVTQWGKNEIGNKFTGLEYWNAR
jgi:DNA-binding PadR family transcriptional regulator